MVDYADLAEAIALEETVEAEPAIAFDEAMERLSGVLTDYRKNGELMAYMRHVRRDALDAMVTIADIDVDKKSEIIALQGRIRDYLRLCRYVGNVMGFARVGQLSDAIDGGDGNLNGEGSKRIDPERTGLRQNHGRV